MSRGFLCWVAWLAGTSWTGITLAEIERFSAVAAVAGGLLAAALVALATRRTRETRAARATSERGALLVPVVAALLSATLLPPIDTTLFSQDASIHLAAGRWLARTGTLAVRDPTLASLTDQERLTLFSGGSSSDKRLSLVRLPGGLVIPDLDETVAYPSFSHLLSVWVAMAQGVAGPSGPDALGVLFSFTAWWAIGSIAAREAGRLAGVAAAALLCTWLPQHWFGRFLMPEILAQALVWSGVALAGFVTERWTPEGRLRADAPPPGLEHVAGVLAGVCLGLAGFARLEQFWVFVPALLLTRAFVPPERKILPAGALVAFLLVSAQAVAHLAILPTDYSNRIYKTSLEVYAEIVLVVLRLTPDGYVAGHVLRWGVPAVALAAVIALLWWGRRLARDRPGLTLRPLLIAFSVFWLILIYSRGLPEEVSVLRSLGWYIPWAVWGAVVLGLPGLRRIPALEIALVLVALDQVVIARVTPEHVWASRRLVTVVLPVVALAAARATGDGNAFGGRLGAWTARALVAVAVVLGAFGLRGLVGEPLQGGARAFAAQVAAALPANSTSVVVRPLDWLHLAPPLWLEHGRHVLVMREKSYPDYEKALERYLRSRGDAPLFVIAGEVVAADAPPAGPEIDAAELPSGLALEPAGAFEWDASFLEVTADRGPEALIGRRARIRLYRVTGLTDPADAGRPGEAGDATAEVGPPG